MARRLPGVDTARVDRATGTLHLDFDGNPQTISKIRGFVQAIGYDITLDSTSPPGINPDSLDPDSPDSPDSEGLDR